MTNALDFLSPVIKNGLFSPYDVVFAAYYTPDRNLTDGMDIVSWFPTRIETKKALMNAIDKIVPADCVEIFNYYFGLFNQKYYSIDEIAKLLKRDNFDISIALCRIATLFSLSDRSLVYKTLPDSAYGEILRGYEVERRNLWEVPV